MTAAGADPMDQKPQNTYFIDVIGRTKLWLSMSGLVLLVGLTSMAFSLATFQAPLRLGLDFSGGTLLDLRFQAPVTTLQIREVLAGQNLGSSVIQLDQENGQTVLLRMPPLQETERLAVEDALREQIGDYERALVETVGPTVGRQILRSGILSVLISFGLIVAYLGVRFQFDYAVFAILALLHDVALTLGIFALLGLTVGLEVDSLFVVALLTIIGFSVNDTVVIFDRIRENRRLISRKVRFEEVVNLSLNQTFGRTLNTTLTTMLPLVAIAVFGGVTLRSFAIALLVGFGLGVYSSIFVASPLLVWWRGMQFSRQPLDQLYDEQPALIAGDREDGPTQDPSRGIV